MIRTHWNTINTSFRQLNQYFQFFSSIFSFNTSPSSLDTCICPFDHVPAALLTKFRSCLRPFASGIIRIRIRIRIFLQVSKLLFYLARWRFGKMNFLPLKVFSFHNKFSHKKHFSLLNLFFTCVIMNMLLLLCY